MKFTKDTIDSVDFSCDSIEFDSSIDDILFMLEKINSFQVEKRVISVNLKVLDFSIKKEIIKWLLKNKNLTHPQFILNVINLIKNYNSLDEEFFNNEKVIFKDLEEFLNIKLELKDEIQQFIDEITIDYFALMMSLHKIESNFLDNIKEMPSSHLHIIRALDFITLSGICAKSQNIQKPNFYIANALDIFQQLVNKMSCADNIMQMLLGSMKEKIFNVSSN